MDDEFTLYDLKVEVIASDKPMVCSHKEGDYFLVIGENLVFPENNSFSMYALGALLPLLPAKQRVLQGNDWMMSDSIIAVSYTHLAQAASLRAAKQDVEAHKILSADKKDQIAKIPSANLVKGDIVIVKAGEQIPGDGEVIEGAASVDESAITGESAPVIREAGGDRSAVTGGTKVLSDWIVVRITSEPGESFLDKMITMVEGAARKKTPNEIALEIFLVALSIIFILVVMALYGYSLFCAKQMGVANPTSVTALVALLV